MEFIQRYKRFELWLIQEKPHLAEDSLAKLYTNGVFQHYDDRAVQALWEAYKAGFSDSDFEFIGQVLHVEERGAGTDYEFSVDSSKAGVDK